MAKTKNITPLSVFILLDRSSSMGFGGKWESAIGAINQYVSKLKETGTPAKITLAAFDSGGTNAVFSGSYMLPAGNGQLYNHPPYTTRSLNRTENLNFSVLRNNVEIESFQLIGYSETHPTGSTPLYDATARLINMADDNNNAKTIIIIMTDGEENTSSIYNLTAIRDRINTCQKRGWEVLFLGAEFNADTIARNYGLDTNKVINSTTRNFTSSMDWYATASAGYTMGNAVDTTKVRDDLSK